MRLIVGAVAVVLIGLGVWLAASNFLQSQSSAAVVATHNVTAKGIILKGYDPVSYFSSATGPRRGRPEFTHRHAGATYRFASAENRDKFKATPARYTPQFGGFCSFGVRSGQKIDIDPTVYRIVNNRLFMQLDRATQTLWLEDEKKNIAIADKLWPKVQSLPFVRE